MRPLEILILVLDFAAILALILPLRPYLGWSKFLPSVSVGITLVHLALERYRWQMVPAYLLTGVLFLLTLPRLTRATEKPALRRAWTFVAGGLGLLWLVIATIPPVVLPVPRAPELPGPYPVGSVVFDWTDSSRDETYSADPGDHRRLMVQIWYPAAPAASAQTAPLIDHWEVAGPAIANYLQVPPFALDHLSLVRTHTHSDAPVATAEAPYPVVIYSHGYTGFRAASLNQVEALASSGYLAVAIDHTYGAMFTVFSDGRAVLNTPEVLPPGDQQAAEVLEATYAADVRFVMDQLELLNAGQSDTRFAGQFDLQRVGLMGHSTGGGAIVWACALDPRCKAGLAMDGWFEPLPEAILSEPLHQPFMFMKSETAFWEGDNQARLESLYQGVEEDAIRLTILGTLHQDFSVLPLVTPISGLLTERGPLDGDRTLKIVTDYLLAFFDRYLKSEASPLLNGPSPEYPEVQFESH